MSMKIGITGLGLCSPLGHSAWSTWAALLEGRGICDRAAPGRCAAGIEATDLARAVGGVAVARGGACDPAVELAERAARQARGADDDQPIPTILAVSKGAVAPTPAPGMVASGKLALGPVDQLAQALARRMPLGPVRQVVAACASSLIGVHLARQWLMDDPTIGRVMVVTSEAALDPIFIHSYKRLGVLPPAEPGRYVARPLDRARCGFVPAEVGAAVVLERNPDDALARVIDSAVACEAHDLVRSGPRKALAHVAERLLLPGVALLHPHATGTVENDEGELAVYAEALGASARDADVYAAKGALGHSLGSSGLTALVLAVLSGRTGRRPPMPWLTHPIDSPLSLCIESPARPYPRQAIFAAGFGGHVAGVTIDTCP